MHPQPEDKMTGVAYMVERLARDEASRVSAAAAVRASVARRCGLPVGTIENIQRSRLKFVSRVEGNIRAAFVRLLQSEIAKATHELEIARLTSDRVDTAAMFAAEADLAAALARAKEVLNGRS